MYLTSNTPSHGTREIFMIFGSLLSSDPGDIHQTMATLIDDNIRVGIVGLAAQVAICRELCTKTNGGDDTRYGVALNEQHFRELVMEVTTPPATYSQKQSTSSLLMMGFPSRTVEAYPSLCTCHSKPSCGGYLCSRCNSKVCGLPAECPSCGLTLILSTHLARSYHHLFPLMNWVEVSWQRASRSSVCFACGIAFPPVPSQEQWQIAESQAKGMSVSSRYECTVCANHFCIDCDLFAHEIVHNCPGCQSRVACLKNAGPSESQITSEIMDTSA
jgi:transcription initiation factor TFIIH subunit 2